MDAIKKPRLAQLDPGAGIYPCQWSGRTTDGEIVYGRYRHGCLTVGVGENEDDAIDSSIACPGLAVHAPCDDGDSWCCDRHFVQAIASRVDGDCDALNLPPCPGKPWHPFGA